MAESTRHDADSRESHDIRPELTLTPHSCLWSVSRRMLAKVARLRAVAMAETMYSVLRLTRVRSAVMRRLDTRRMEERMIAAR